MVRLLLLLLTLCSLTGCVTPMRLGISEAEWSNYSPEEKEKIKSGYYEVLKSRFHEDEKIIPDGTRLNVRVSDGQVGMPPFIDLCRYHPLEFNIPSGDCQTVKMTEQGGEKEVRMKVCYINKTLYLDPSRFDPNKKVGSIQLHYSPIWDRGFTYRNVSSSGYAHLTNVNVTLKKYDSNEQGDNANS